MLDRFLEFIKKHALIDQGDHLLLAVSGGVDSMAMLDLFSETSFRFSVAHCNFQLRGKESDLDEKLVNSTCDELKVTLNKKRFDTKKYSKTHGISTQMAARDLRFEWFEALCKRNGYSKVVLAHHRDDAIETFFLNLTRGTSLRGLRGIQPKNNRLIRPMLAFTKEEILDYAKSEGLLWREDASNQETYYKRNLIRHELLPVLKKLNPDFEKVMVENMEKLDLRFETSEKHYDNIFQQAVEVVGDEFKANISKLKAGCNNAYDLYEVLRVFNINYATASDLFSAIQNNASGKVFKSPNYQLIVDREFIIIRPNDFGQSIAKVLTIEIADETKSTCINDVEYEICRVAASSWQMIKSASVGAFDYKKLQFPLKVRPWQEGDSFQPLGMNGKKLVSDLLIDLKIPVTQKSGVMVMLSAGEIIWVVGIRISEKFKVGTATKTVWEVKSSEFSH